MREAMRKCVVMHACLYLSFLASTRVWISKAFSYCLSFLQYLPILNFVRQIKSIAVCQETPSIPFRLGKYYVSPRHAMQ
ncbi:hypothetical protein F5882DRAFT_143473 [Hyaloscypha sp. PMI_1271]|nr:hypothetical protein F5882DRAFT_143473 [Hyaloscypha sp. PMI_1271]